MSVGFGFSVGDFIAAIELVGTVADALRSSGQAGAEYRELLHQLLSLESALIQVKRLEVGEGVYEEIIALRQAAAQCGRMIDAFWERTRKYQPALGGIGSGSRIRDGWMKIRWAVCRKEDVARFKADLVGHTESIQLLLTTVQLRQTRINDQKQHDSQTTLAGRVQEGYFSCMQRLLVVVGQGKQTLDMISSILRTNVKVFQIALQIQQMITRIPGQVDRQQPVHMIDALGRTSPFHLEFVRSAEALVAVLKVNFKKHDDAAKRIENGDFVIQDAATKRDIDLSTDWDICFAPGQRVVMSIILTRALVPDITCPKCHTPNFGVSIFDREVDVECPSCGLTYRRIFSKDNGTETDLFDQKSQTSGTDSMDSSTPEKFGPSPKTLKRKLEADDLGDLRRVRIRDSALDMMERPPSPRRSLPPLPSPHEIQQRLHNPLLGKEVHNSSPPSFLAPIPKLVNGSWEGERKFRLDGDAAEKKIFEALRPPPLWSLQMHKAYQHKPVTALAAEVSGARGARALARGSSSMAASGLFIRERETYGYGRVNRIS